MKLSLLLDPRLIRIGVPCNSYASAMRAVLDPIRRNYSFEVSGEDIESALLRPGESCEDRIENGIAVTRANIPRLTDLLVSILVPAAPVKAREGDVRLFVLLLSGGEASEQALKVGEAFARLAADEKLFATLLATHSVSGLMGELDRANIAVPSELTVSTVMMREVLTVAPATTLRELLILLTSRNATFITVADPAGRFLGEIHLEDILRLGFPDYAFQLGNLSFLSSFQPFSELLDKGLSTTAERLMKVPSYRLTPDTGVAEAVFEMVNHHHRSAAVIGAGEKPVGVLNTTDLLRKLFNLN